jgi:hypothetical protein
MRFLSRMVLSVAGLAILCGALAAPAAAQKMSGAAPAAPPPAAPPPPALTTQYKGILPADVVLHVTTGPLGKSIENIEAMVMKAVEGTPLAMQIQKGMLKGMILGLLPPGLVDLKGHAQFILCNPQLGAQGGPSLGVVLPVRGFKKKIALLQQAQIGVTAAQPGLYTMNFMGSPMAVAEAGPDHIVVGESPAGVKHVAGILRKQAVTSPLRKRTSATLMVTADLGKLTALNMPKIDEGFAEMTEELQQVVAGQDTPPVVKNLAQLAPNYMNSTKAFLLGLRSARFYVYAGAPQLRIAGFITPKRETPFRKMAEAYEATNPTYALANLLPANAIEVVAFNYDAAASADLNAFLAALTRDLATAVLGQDQGTRVGTMMKKAMAMATGEGAMALVANKDGSGQSTVGYSRVADAEGYMKTVGELTDPVNEVLGAVLKLAEAPMRMTMVYNPAAGKAAGVPYAGLGWKIEPAEEGDGNPDPMTKMMQDMMDKQYARMTAVGDVIVYAQGADGETLLGEAIGALKKKTVRLGGNARFTAALNATKPKQIAFVSAYLIDAVKTALLQNPAVAQAGPNVVQALKQLPKSTMPITMSIGVKKGSPKIQVTVPTKAVSEAVQAGFVVFRAMQAGAGGGGMPPMPPVNP